jgi:hypothetical protein
MSSLAKKISLDGAVAAALATQFLLNQAAEKLF